jgi:hypothetical protein
MIDLPPRPLLGGTRPWKPSTRLRECRAVTPAANTRDTGRKRPFSGRRCGYFDRGAKHRDPEAVLQRACAVRYQSEEVADAQRNGRDPKDGLISSAVLDLIPAGETVKPDKKWPLALHLCQGGDMCGSSGMTPVLPGKRR